MAITANAKKAHRASLKKHVYNVRRKRVLTSTTKDVRKLITAGSKTEANTSLSAAFKALDKAAQKKVLKKNTVARKKSRLNAMVKKIVLKK
jgi:small subunit ribosomal protein S20